MGGGGGDGDCGGVAIPIGLGYYLRSKSITKPFCCVLA